ncbi:MAG: hypothetical protein HY738_19560, partial [Bacteroidia bacterium]|nr:hypothetical protein [Bacteroidia bacterium]
EGICIVEKRLRKLKKGTARIAFRALDKGKNIEDIYIVPVGINYTEPTKVREEVMFQIGEPFQTSQFKALYLKNPAVAINEFNEKLAHELEKVVIAIHDKNNEQLTEWLFIIYRNETKEKPLQWRNEFDARFKMEYEISMTINKLAKESQEKINNLKTTVGDYFERLEINRISDKKIKTGSQMILGKIIIVFLLFPFSAVGFISNFIPFIISKGITNRVVKDIVFYASVLWGSSVALYSIWFILLEIFALSFFSWWAVLVPPVIPALGYLSLIFYDMALDIQEDFNMLRVMKKAPLLINNLKVARNHILSEFNKLRKDALMPLPDCLKC